MKTYHMYHAESISAESKLKEAEKQEEKQFNKAGDISVNLLRHEDRPQRRSSVKKIEKMKEKRGMPPACFDTCSFPEDLFGMAIEECFSLSSLLAVEKCQEDSSLKKKENYVIGELCEFMYSMPRMKSLG
ncbi:UNVERIFIED_CONTAM: hypothetical protein K2H54_054332 [Gekko kuhli]